MIMFSITTSTQAMLNTEVFSTRREYARCLDNLLGLLLNGKTTLREARLEAFEKPTGFIASNDTRVKAARHQGISSKVKCSNGGGKGKGQA